MISLLFLCWFIKNSFIKYYANREYAKIYLLWNHFYYLFVFLSCRIQCSSSFTAAWWLVSATTVGCQFVIACSPGVHANIFSIIMNIIEHTVYIRSIRRLARSDASLDQTPRSIRRLPRLVAALELSVFPYPLELDPADASHILWGFYSTAAFIKFRGIGDSNHS